MVSIGTFKYHIFLLKIKAGFRGSHCLKKSNNIYNIIQFRVSNPDIIESVGSRYEGITGFLIQKVRGNNMRGRNFWGKKLDYFFQLSFFQFFWQTRKPRFRKSQDVDRIGKHYKGTT
jgi:hypothetical protein